jgi:hypothetical protein
MVVNGLTVPLWYEWSLQHWGTKWNACDARYSDLDQNIIHFDTAWAPPIPIFEAVAKLFPEHEFLIYSDELMNHVHLSFVAKHGELAGADCPCECFGANQGEDGDSPLSVAHFSSSEDSSPAWLPAKADLSRGR